MKKLGATAQATWTLIQEGRSLEEVAEYRHIRPETVVGHLEQCIAHGKSIDLDRFVSPQLQPRVRDLFERHGCSNVGAIVEEADGDVTYLQARLMRACIQAADSSAEEET